MTIIIERRTVYGIGWAAGASGNPARTVFADDYEVETSHMVRAIKLGQAPQGSGHDCFLKGITVNFDVYMPRWMQTHLLRYSHVNVVSAMSVQKNLKQIVYDNGCWVDIDKEYVQWYRLQYESDKPKDYLVRHIPEGLLLGISFTANYLQLKTIVNQRKYHSMDEWREFCQEVMNLPMFTELTGVHYT